MNTELTCPNCGYVGDDVRLGSVGEMLDCPSCNYDPIAERQADTLHEQRMNHGKR